MVYQSETSMNWTNHPLFAAVWKSSKLAAKAIQKRRRLLFLCHSWRGSRGLWTSLVKSAMDRRQVPMQRSTKAYRIFAHGKQPDSCIVIPEHALIISRLNALLQLLVLQNPALVQKANHQQQAALMTSLQNLFTHPHLENSVGVSQYTFDVATYLSDYIAEDVRKHLSRLVYAKGGSDPRSTFIFGSEPQPDGWLGLVKPAPPQQLQTPGSMQSQMQGQQSNAANMLGQRGSSQQQYQQGMQNQAQTRSFGYPQHQQTQRVLPQQLQRAASSPNHPTSQLQQMQQMQQMQAMSQQRIGPPQRSSSGSSQTSTAGKAGPARQERVDSKPVPFTVNRWELLPETGTSATGNETAINLSLFGARKV